MASLVNRRSPNVPQPLVLLEQLLSGQSGQSGQCHGRVGRASLGQPVPVNDSAVLQMQEAP